MNVYTIADDLSQAPKLSREEILNIANKAKAARKARQKKRREKIKKGFKKFGRGLATVFLAPARGAFYAYVALNINGIANQLKWVFDNEKGKAASEAKAIKKKLKDIGVRKFATLLKSINQGAKKKPFFFSKKAKRKLTAQAKQKGFSAKGINGADGIYLEPASTATIIASSAAVVGAIIPIILKAMDKKGDASQVQQATETAQETYQNLQQNPDIQQYQAQNPQLQPESMEGIGRLDPQITGALVQGVTSLANYGLNAAAVAIERKAAKNPKLKAALQRGNEAVENYAAGQYLRKAGAIDDAKAISQTYGGLTKYIIPAAVVGGVLLFTMRKK